MELQVSNIVLKVLLSMFNTCQFGTPVSQSKDLMCERCFTIYSLSLLIEHKWTYMQFELNTLPPIILSIGEIVTHTSA